MKAKSVLVLGGATMQLPAVRSALSKGWTVAVADKNPEVPAASLCHHFIPVDLRDVEGMIEAARELKKREGLDGVFTAGTDFSYTVARVAEALGLPGVSPRTARAASDKVVMRQVFAEKGIPAPRFVRIAEGEDPRTRVRVLSFPLVVKPVDNMGSRGVRRVDTGIELSQAVADARRNSHSGDVIVEEMIEGPEFSIDALVEKGEVFITGFADRIIRFSPYFVEMGHTLPSEREPKLRLRIESTFVDAIHALGIDNGAAKGDVKWNGREAVVGEVAARLSGGYMSGWTFPYATGIALSSAALNIAVGLPAGDLAPRFEKVSAERAFISIPGIVESIEGEAAARRRAGVKELFLRLSPGDPVSFPTNNVEKCGNIIAVDAVRERACEIAEAASRTIWVRLRPKERRTKAFLFRREEGWIEDAFTLFVPENSRRLAEMPPLRYSGGGAGSISGAGSTGAPELLLEPLSSLELEEGVDWHGEILLEACERILAFSGARFITESEADGVAADAADNRQSFPPVLVLGSLFWTAVLRGGVQGGVWLIETVRRMLHEGEDLRDWLESNE
jgi:biotin carboxylase